MNRVGRAAVMLTLGLISARMLWTGSFGWFIQQRMRWPLLAATIVLLMLGVYEGVKGAQEESDNPNTMRLPRAPRIGWMMVLPLVVLVSVAPTGLGAAAADRVENFTPVDSEDLFEDLDTSNGPVELRLLDFVNRALWDEQRSVEDTTIRLEGLVVNDPDVPDGFLLTRFLVSCCAADGVPIQVAVRGVEQSLPDDTWVVTEVVWREPDIPYIEIEDDVWFVEADLQSITVDPTPPTDAYESPYE